MDRESITSIREDYRGVTSPEEIEKAAEILLGNEKQFPLPVVDFMQRLGFGVFRTNFRNPQQSGLIVVDSSLPEKNSVFTSSRAILLNRDDSVEHQRFTVGHELGHYIFDFDEQSTAVFYKAYYTTDDRAAQPEEVRAGRFAAALLMPQVEFRELFQKIKNERGKSFSLPDAISELKSYFGTPATAVQRRIDELGLNN